MRIIGIENFICDYYITDDKTYINGGGTVANILVNLDFFAISCKLIGYCGNDTQGNWIRNSLKGTNVDLSDIIITGKTKKFFMKDGKYSSTCPICKQKAKRYPAIKIETILPLIKKDDWILIKDFSVLNNQIINQIKNPILIDIGYTKPLLHLEESEIIPFITYPYKMINLKEEVLIFLCNKLRIDKEKLLKEMKAEIIMITKGKNGVEFLFKNRQYQYKLKKPFKEIETNGCGDSFFSCAINRITREKNITEKTFKMIFDEGNKLVKQVVSQIGARNHLIPNGILTSYKNCICDEIDIK